MCIWYRFNEVTPPVTDEYVTEDESQYYENEAGTAKYIPET